MMCGCDKCRAAVFRAQARQFCLRLNRYLIHNVLPRELLEDVSVCLEVAVQTYPDGSTWS